MSRTFEAIDLVNLPQLSAADAMTLSAALVARAHALAPLPMSIGRSLGLVESALDELRQAVRRRLGDGSAEGIAVPAVDRLLEAAWAAAQRAETSGRLLDAVDAYGEVATLDGGDPEVHYRLGNVLSRLGKDRQARVAYQMTIQLDPGYLKAYNNLGTTFTRLGEPEKAIVVLKTAIKIDPEIAARAMVPLQRMLDFKPA